MISWYLEVPMAADKLISKLSVVWQRNFAVVCTAERCLTSARDIS